MEQLAKVYFAHPVNTYNTILEQYCLQWFGRMPPHELINPNELKHQVGYAEGGMDYFKNIVEGCQYVFALPFGDKSFGAGIAKEIQWALDKNIKVVRMTFFDQEEIFSLKDCTVLSVEQTRTKLKETF